MNEVKSFIESGILEMYVMGNTSPEETLQVEEMAALYEEVHNEIRNISIALEKYAALHAEEPDPTIKTFLTATIDYMERIKNGEPVSFPPMLHPGSKALDYAEWLNREDLQPAEPLEDAYASIIGYTPDVITAIVWLRYGAPSETHDKELEKFLVLEGTCEITMGTEVRSMKAGDVLIIPLHLTHHVNVTSSYPCKIILQRERVAA